LPVGEWCRRGLRPPGGEIGGGRCQGMSQEVCVGAPAHLPEGLPELALSGEVQVAGQLEHGDAQ